MDSLPDKDLSCVNDFVSVVNAVTAQVRRVFLRGSLRVQNGLLLSHSVHVATRLAVRMNANRVE